MENTAELFEKIFPFWKDISKEEQKYLVDNSIENCYKKNVVIHRSDQDCKGIMIVTKGQLRAYIISEEGREVTLFRIRQGEVCVMSASCLLDSIMFDILIDSIEETDVIMIPSQIFLSVMKKNPVVELFVYKSSTERFSDVMWAMQQILFMDMDKRVAVFLWDEMARSKSSVIKYTHEEIAKYIGSAREVVTKVLKYFVEEKVVVLKRGCVEIIDKEKLKRYI